MSGRGVLLASPRQALPQLPGRLGAVAAAAAWALPLPPIVDALGAVAAAEAFVTSGALKTVLFSPPLLRDVRLPGDNLR
jgi:hypothetical protein